MLKNIIGVLLLMVVGGLFSWMNSTKGLLLICFFAVMLKYFNVLTISYTTIIFAIFVSIMAAFARGAKS